MTTLNERIARAEALRESGFVPDMRGAPSRPGREANYNALSLVKAERARQDAKWGEQNHGPDTWIRILGEEYGEVCKAVNESDLREYRNELIQVAAVAVAAVECLDRARTVPGPGPGTMGAMSAEATPPHQTQRNEG